jgi:phosphate-selective porin OprO/OprP
MKRIRRSCIFAIVVATVASGPVLAGIRIYEDGHNFVEVGGRIQLQYANTEVDGEAVIDEIYFRRLRPYIAASVTENWSGKIEVDFGKSLDQDEVAVKDAYMEYTGWKNKTLTIGNSKTPFSREFLTSSKRQQTVERGFVGDHNFGTPDRQLGFRVSGHNDSKKITYQVAVGAEHHDPAVERMDFDTPVNNADDWNEGVVVGGRIDFHPWGNMKFEQGDFHSDEFKATFSLGFFSWSNDGDNNFYTDPGTGLSISTSKADLDRAEGIEISGGLRGRGFSVDLEYNLVSGDTVDPTFTGGVYRNGSTDLDKYQIEGGYMLASTPLEIVARYQSLDADNYEEAWNATELGLNYFWNKHETKVQLTYRLGENFSGRKGVDSETILVQWQFVF